VLEDLCRRLWPGGRIAIASRPRRLGSTRGTSLDAASRITDLLQTAGFSQTHTDILELNPPVVCVLAVNPEPTPDRGSSALDLRD
jgi:hypothetical protein